MANLVVLIRDARVRQQLETYLEEMNLPDLRTAFFESVAEFESLYFKDPTSTAAAEVSEAAPGAESPPPAASPPPEESGPVDTELRLFSEVHVFIYALDGAGDVASTHWLERLRGTLKRYNHLPPAGLQVIALKYEDEVIPRVEALHTILDDLIYLPLDRLVFLQKMQIFLALPKRAKPTFLFNQPIEQRIEISKITKLDRLSDTALAIRNPVALRKGLPGHFYLQFPGEKAVLEIKGKVLRSEPHPDHPGQFMVYFAYFGATKAAISTIRRALQKDTHYKSLEFDDHKRFAFNEDNLFLADEDKHRFGVVIIDREEHEATQLADALRNEMDRLDVQIESSYSLFLHRYLERDTVSFGANPPKPTEVADYWAQPIELVVKSSDQSLVEVTPPPVAETDLLLGFRADELLGENSGWSRILADKVTRALIEEAPLLTANGKPYEKVIVLHDAQNERRASKLTLSPGPHEGTVKVALAPASVADVMARAAGDRKHEKLEALLVEGGLLPQDPVAWVEGLRGRARQVGLTSQGHDLKFWAVTDRDDFPESWLNTPEILGLFRRPVDLRQLLFSFSEHLPNTNTVYQFHNLGWSHPGLNLHVSKPIHIEALSEYGATLRSNQRLVPGSVIYLRKSIFDNAPNQYLAARVYACEEHPNEEGAFQIFVTYWGISDAFLKFARTWIRDNYAANKSKA